MKTQIVLIILMLFGYFNVSIADDFDQKINQQSKKIDQIERDLQKKRAERKSLQSKEAGALAQLKASEEEVELIERFLTELIIKERQLNMQIEFTTLELAEAESLLAWQQNILERRLADIYKSGKFNELEILLTANSFTDMLERYHYMQLIAEQDRRLFDEIEVQKGIVAERKSALEAHLAELKSTIATKNEEKSALERERERRKTLVADIRNQKSSYEKAIAELEQAQREARKIIDQLIAQREHERQKAEAAKQKKDNNDLSLGPDSKLPKRSGKHYFDKNRGKIGWPVSGTLITKFGREKHPRFGTETFNQGIRIQANAGTPIRAVDGGEVIYRSTLRGFGKFMIIDHGEGYYTLYGHCQSIDVGVGQTVNRGDVIAKVGDTGSMVGNCLYFEVRSFGEPVDPLLYLKR